MSIEALFSNFDRLIQSPESVQGLRRFILDLAVRGRLVPQDPADEPTSKLLGRIGKERSSPPKSHLPLISENEKAFTIPKGWEWVRLGNISTSLLGKTLNKAKNRGDYQPYLRSVNVYWLELKLSDIKQMKFEEHELEKYALQKGDVLVCEGGEAGRAAVWNNEMQDIYYQNALHRVRFFGKINPNYFVFALYSDFNNGRLESYCTGIAIKHLTGKRLAKYCFPLPPLAEQRRIVAKVDELMALCDQLEAARAERETARTRLTAASLARLNNPDSDEVKFREHVSFVLNNLAPLTTRPEQIKALRQTILNLAVRGKLVPQDPEDEPASELLKRIGKEKARLVKAGEIKKNRAKPVRMAKAPFALPRSWKWASIGDVFLYDAGTKREPAALDQSRWLLELEDMEKDTGNLLARIRVSERKSKSTKSEFRVGDILYGKLRPYLNKVFVADEPGYSTTEIVALRPHLPLCSQYCALALRRPDFVSYATRLGQGTKMPRLRTADATIAPFPLPPLPEQRRIVAKVDELMALCDQLERGTEAEDNTQGQLFGALLHNVWKGQELADSPGIRP